MPVTLSTVRVRIRVGQGRQLVALQEATAAPYGPETACKLVNPDANPNPNPNQVTLNMGMPMPSWYDITSLVRVRARDLG